jgi:hypothetical protein
MIIMYTDFDLPLVNCDLEFSHNLGQTENKTPLRLTSRGVLACARKQKWLLPFLSLGLAVLLAFPDSRFAEFY